MKQPEYMRLGHLLEVKILFLQIGTTHCRVIQPWITRLLMQEIRVMKDRR